MSAAQTPPITIMTSNGIRNAHNRTTRRRHGSPHLSNNMWAPPSRPGGRSMRRCPAAGPSCPAAPRQRRVRPTRPIRRHQRRPVVPAGHCLDVGPDQRRHIPSWFQRAHEGDPWLPTHAEIVGCGGDLPFLRHPEELMVDAVMGDDQCGRIGMCQPAPVRPRLLLLGTTQTGAARSGSSPEEAALDPGAQTTVGEEGGAMEGDDHRDRRDERHGVVRRMDGVDREPLATGTGWSALRQAGPAGCRVPLRSG